MGAMLKGVSEDMHAMLLNKKLAKEAWESLKTMHLGVDQVKEVDAQKLLSDFEAISFKTGETIEEFTMRITKLVAELRSLGETRVDDAWVVKKFLRVVPSRYNQVAVAIEMFCEVKTLSIKELFGRLRAVEAWFGPTVEQVTDKTGRLLLTEEEWMARNKSHMVDDSSSSGGKGGRKYIKKDQSGGCGVSSGGGKHGHDTCESGGALTSKGMPRWKGRCRKCGVYGH